MQGEFANAASRELLLTELAHAASRVPTDLLVPLLSMTAELSGRQGTPRSAGTLRRAIERGRILQRFAELRRDPKCTGWDNLRLLRELLTEVRRRFPQMKCSTRTLQRWIHDWNSTADGGLARGFVALIDAYGRPPLRR